MWNDNEKKILEIEDNLYLEKNNYPVKCPVCGKNDGHLFYYEHQSSLNKGGKWIWCSSCFKCSHAYASIPEWWRNPEFIDSEKLAAVPDYLESNKDKIDSWINELMQSSSAK